MGEYRLICILGESAAGKTSVAEKLMHDSKMKKIITYTTRPPREGEKDGIDYHFVTQNLFAAMEKAGEFAETGEYNNWKYGTASCDCIDNGISVVTPSGFRKLKKNRNIKIISFYLNVPRRDRLIKSLKTRDDIDECINRNLRDLGQFDGVEDEVDFVISNPSYTRSPDDISKEILRLVGQRK